MKWAEIDRGAITGNVAALTRHVGSNVAVMAMVKANGYGHGAIAAGEAALAGGATWLGVSSAEEAIQLVDAGLQATVLTVGWTPPSQVEALVRRGVHLTVYDPACLDDIVATARAAGRPALLHIKLDSGMGRLGARREVVPALVEALRRGGDAVELRGLFTHFADADGADVDFTEVQHARFLEAATALRQVGSGALLHCANSAATLRLPHMHHDIVRPGIAIYGYAPPACGGIVDLRPAMSLHCSVTLAKTVRAGDSVGYGRTWVAEHDTLVATLACGYADGIHRAQSNRGVALVGGVRVPFIGRVSMDQITLDISDVEGVSIGDEAVLFGRQESAELGADEVAARIGTISYEILCAVSARVPRVVV
ncbi:MAG: alanine racemase [Candidatus Dormibacteria bacterium]